MFFVKLGLTSSNSNEFYAWLRKELFCNIVKRLHDEVLKPVLVS